MSPLLDVLARLDPRAVVQARALVGARELLERVVAVGAAAVRLDHDLEYRRGVDRLESFGCAMSITVPATSATIISPESLAA